MADEVVVVGVGPNSNIEAQVDPTFQAARVNVRPTEFKDQGGLIGGHFYLTAGFSNTAAKPAAASDVLSLRWADSRLLFVLKRLGVWVVTTTAYTATLNQDLAAFRATGFSVAASAGTQIIPLGGGQQRARTATMSATLLASGGGALWVSSGDLLTTGTRTLDTQPFGYAAYSNAITTPNLPTFGVLYEEREMGQHPLVLGANEGIVVQTPIGNAQAAGVSKYTFILEWAEVPNF